MWLTKPEGYDLNCYACGQYIQKDEAAIWQDRDLTAGKCSLYIPAGFGMHLECYIETMIKNPRER